MQNGGEFSKPFIYRGVAHCVTPFFHTFATQEFAKADSKNNRLLTNKTFMKRQILRNVLLFVCLIGALPAVFAVILPLLSTLATASEEDVQVTA